VALRRRSWRAIATVHQRSQRFASDKRSSNARIGDALYRAGRIEDAITAYAAAIVGRPNAGWEDVTGTTTGPDRDIQIPAHWYHRLGTCLTRKKQYCAAASVLRIACELAPSNLAWFKQLSKLEIRTDNSYGRAWAERRIIAAEADVAFQRRVGLAADFEHLGLWLDAQHVLADDLDRNSTNAQAYKLVARAASAHETWGGTFTDGGLRQPAALFNFSQEPLISSIDALERAVALNPSNTRWRAAFADALVAGGHHERAIELFDAALREAQRSTERWALGVKQRWQFQLERCHHDLGRPRVEDPLFACDAAPAGEQVSGTRVIAGLFGVRWSYLGMTIHGLVTSDTTDYVDVVVNGTTIRSIKVSDEGHYPRFTITLKRPTIALLPEHAKLEVRHASGEPLYAPGGFSRIDVSIPHGTGKLIGILAAGSKLSKKGRIAPTLDTVQRRQLESLDVYSRLRDFFRTKLGRDVFLMYGTLLGFHRDGDFIPSDDDFDAGYVSNEANPRAVKQEAQDLILELVRAGFGVSFNWRGRLMRVHPPGGSVTGAHVDFRPLWFQRGKVWAHNHLCMPADSDDILPTTEGKLRGVPVSLPRNTEAFLRWQYGPGWKVPDPGFAYHSSDVDPQVRKHLTKALITAGEYRELLARIERAGNGSGQTGRLVALGDRDLYPGNW
jgi:tetratricopeptide (TPR) repeat protein